MARATAEVIAPTDTDDLPEGSVNKYDTGAPPADTDALEEGSTNKYDTGVPPTTSETQANLKAMADADKEIVFSEPLPGEHKIYGIHRNAAGNPEYDYEDVAES